MTILTKAYQVTLNINEVGNFCANPTTGTMNLLQSLYVGRCHQGAFVIKIVKVVKRSACHIKNTSFDGEGYVYVEFLALVSVIAMWDIISDVHIQSTAALIVGKANVEGSSLVVSLLPSKESKTVATKQIVSVRVAKVKYNPWQEEASALGVLLTCDRGSPAFYLKGTLSFEDAKALTPLVARVQSLLAIREKLMSIRRDDVLFFDALIYSYALPSDAPVAAPVKSNKAATWEGSSVLAPPAGTVNILDIVTTITQDSAKPVNVEGYWCRDLALHRTAPLVVHTATSSPGWNAATASEPCPAFAVMLKSIADFLDAVNSFCATYSTVAAVTDHRNIWTVMRHAQLPPP
jgi:hypothetical protein